uniref:Uncharacterized protein n=1 Tax=Anguilla anguilla TaxID=7936 RepID=A0A0E9QA43_ANGAN
MFFLFIYNYYTYGDNLRISTLNCPKAQQCFY